MATSSAPTSSTNSRSPCRWCLWQVSMQVFQSASCWRRLVHHRFNRMACTPFAVAAASPPWSGRWPYVLWRVHNLDLPNRFLASGGCGLWTHWSPLARGSKCCSHRRSFRLDFASAPVVQAIRGLRGVERGPPKLLVTPPTRTEPCVACFI